MYTKSKIKDIKCIDFVVKLCKPFAFWIWILLIINLSLAILLSIRPYYLKQIIDNVPLYENAGSIRVYVPMFMYFFISITSVSLLRLNDYIQNIKLLPYTTQAITKQIVELSLKSPSFYMTYQKSENLTEAILDIMYAVPEVINIIINKFVYLFFAVLIGALILYCVTPLFSVVLLSWIAMVSYVLRISFTKISSSSQKSIRSISDLKHNIFDVLTNIISVRLNNSISAEKQYIDHILDKSTLLQKSIAIQHLWMWAVYGYSFVAMLCINLFLLIEYQKLNMVLVGDFALVLTINIIIFDIFWTIFRDSASFVSAMGKIKLGLDCISNNLSEESITAQIKHFPTLGKIVYDKVCLSINDKKILNNINTSITLGQKVAIVGNSGSGKSSFVNLLVGLLSPSSGKIVCQHTNMSDLAINEHVCFISPDISLFDRSVYDNITYGNKSANTEEVLLAARLAEAHDFIASMPEGYNTVLSKNGIMLSAGQKQRILLARAMLQRSHITILDEATSHIDDSTEIKILNNFLKILHDKTIIVITHKLHNIGFADKVIVLKNGAIVSEGPHEELYTAAALFGFNEK